MMVPRYGVELRAQPIGFNDKGHDDRTRRNATTRRLGQPFDQDTETPPT